MSQKARRKTDTQQAESLKIKRLISFNTQNRKVWRSIQIQEIINKSIRLTDVVRYEVLFQNCSEAIWIDREELRKYRPRGYSFQLEEIDSKEEHHIEKLLLRRVINRVVEYYVKFWRYPDTDNTWVRADRLENWERLEWQVNGQANKSTQVRTHVTGTLDACIVCGY